MASGHRDEIAGDFPGREQTQAAGLSLLKTAALQIAAPCITGPGDRLETLGRGGAAQSGTGLIGINAEIGGQMAWGLGWHEGS